MKLSISVPDETVELLDRVVKMRGITSRSAAIQQGIDLLVNDSLLASYRVAFAEFDEQGDGEIWDGVAGDGIDDEATWW
jgi:Arc/MetJ-type ribon-helix-helix transcriptional regulator